MKPYQFLDQAPVKRQLSHIFTGFFLGLLTYLFIVYSADIDSQILLLSGIAGIVIAYITTWLSKGLNHLISWKQYTGARLLSGILLIASVAFLICLSGIYIYTFLKSEEESFWSIYGESLLKLGILLFLISLIYNVIYFALYSYYQYAKGQLHNIQTNFFTTNCFKIAIEPTFSF